MKKVSFMALLVFIVTIVDVPMLHGQSEADDLATRLKQAIAQNLWDDVLLLSSDMLIEDPTSGDAYYYTALAFYRLGDIEKAREYVELTNDFEDEELIGWVTKLREEMDYSESMDKAATQIGTIQQSGNAAVAANEWRDLWTQDKSQVDFALNAVQLYVQQKRYLEALEILGDPTLRTVPEANQAVRAINGTPEMVAHYAYMNAMRDGNQALLSGNYQQAIGQFNTALRVRANDPDASRLKRDSEDELAWMTATGAHSIASYDAYLAGDTNKKYASEARSLVRDALIFHGRNFAGSDNVDQAEYHLNRLQKEYPTDQAVPEARMLLCAMYTRIGDRNAVGKTVATQRSAVEYYTRAQNICADRGTFGPKIASSNRKAINWARPSQTFMAFAFDELSTYGITMGNVHTRGSGFYFTVRANQALFENFDPYTVDDNGDLDGASSTYVYRDTGERQTMNGEGLLGMTYELAYPLWLYAGVGVAYNAEQWEIDEYLRGSLSDTQWIRNTDQTRYEPVLEAGVMLNISGVHLQAGIKGYDMERTFITLGAGFTF
jgi:tetratricopeptide (TPR) repeat protein